MPAQVAGGKFLHYFFIRPQNILLDCFIEDENAYQLRVTGQSAMLVNTRKRYIAPTFMACNPGAIACCRLVNSTKLCCERFLSFNYAFIEMSQ